MPAKKDPSSIPTLSPAGESAMAAIERKRRSQRALALASLLGRGAREFPGVTELSLETQVRHGTSYLEEELLEEMVELLDLET